MNHNFWKGRVKWPLMLALVIAAVDQITKLFVRANMFLGESIPVEGRFRLTYSTNEGGAFGLDINPLFLLVFGFAVLIMLLWICLYYLKSRGGILRVGLGLVVGGAIGNLIDRICFGEVTDFLDVRLWGDYHWPTFNVADSALSVGICIIIYAILVEGAGEKDNLDEIPQ